MTTIITGGKQSAGVHWTVNRVTGASKKKPFIIVGDLSQLVTIYGRVKDKVFTFVELDKPFTGGNALLQPEDFPLLAGVDLQEFTLVVLNGAEQLDGLDRFKEVFLLNCPKGLITGEHKTKRLIEDTTKDKVEINQRNKKGYIEKTWIPVYRLV